MLQNFRVPGISKSCENLPKVSTQNATSGCIQTHLQFKFSICSRWRGGEIPPLRLQMPLWTKLSCRRGHHSDGSGHKHLPSYMFLNLPSTYAVLHGIVVYLGVPSKKINSRPSPRMVVELDSLWIYHTWNVNSIWVTKNSSDFHPLIKRDSFFTRSAEKLEGLAISCAGACDT